MQQRKILYALSDRPGAQIQYMRIAQNLPPNTQIKVAGYASQCNLIQLDWNLDAFKDAIDLQRISLQNENVAIFADQVKAFNPDLIISDLELITSYIAIAFKKELWQVSPMLLYYATTNDVKSDLNSRRRFSYTLKSLIKSKDFANYAITNSSKNLIYSHFGDASSFQIDSNFSWVRPYFYYADYSKAAEYTCFGASIKSNKHFLNILRDYGDSVFFSSFLQEQYPNVKIKDLQNTSEYIINLKNAKHVVTECYADFLADCYYNQKFANMFVNFDDIESVLNYLGNDLLGIGKSINSNSSLNDAKINAKVNSNIKFFDQHLTER